MKTKKKVQNQKKNISKTGEKGKLGKFRNMDLDFKFLHRKEGVQDSDVNLTVEDFSALSFDSETHLLFELQKAEAKVLKKKKF